MCKGHTPTDFSGNLFPGLQLSYIVLSKIDMTDKWKEYFSSTQNLTPACGVHVLWLRQINSHGLQKPCGEKGQHGCSLSERGPRPRPGQAFIAFLGTLHRGLVLIHYAQVCFRWLPFTDNKGKNVANSKRRMFQMQGEKWLNWLHSILGRFSTDFRKLV